MRKSLTLTGAALLIAIPSFVFAQSGAGGAGVGNSDSSAGVPGNVHSGPNSMGAQPGIGYGGRSSATSPIQPENQVGDSPSIRSDKKGYDADDAH